MIAANNYEMEKPVYRNLVVRAGNTAAAACPTFPEGRAQFIGEVNR